MRLTSDFLIFLTVLGVVVSNSDRPVDCRKFVFAPLCRGVAAKRVNSGNDDSIGHVEPAIYFNPKTFKEFFRNLLTEIEISQNKEDEENDDGNKLYSQQNRENYLYKLLPESQKSSELNGNLAREFDTL